MASLITRLGIGLLSKVVDILIVAGITIWDLALILYNLVAPEREVGKVTPAGCPGAGGKWPEYIAPKEGDSRCSCPALNAMANHGAYAYSHTLKLRRSAPYLYLYLVFPASLSSSLLLQQRSTDWQFFRTLSWYGTF